MERDVRRREKREKKRERETSGTQAVSLRATDRDRVREMGDGNNATV